MNQPSAEQQQRDQEIRDSIALVEQNQQIIEEPEEELTEEKQIVPIASQDLPDSIKQQLLNSEFGIFTNSALGTEEDFVVDK